MLFFMRSQSSAITATFQSFRISQMPSQFEWQSVVFLLLWSNYCITVKRCTQCDLSRGFTINYPKSL